MKFKAQLKRFMDWDFWAWMFIAGFAVTSVGAAVAGNWDVALVSGVFAAGAWITRDRPSKHSQEDDGKSG